VTAIEILSKLVSFPVVGGKSNVSIAEWIENYLSEHGISCRTLPNPEGNKRSIHCRIGPAEDGGLVLSGHMDVVPTEGQPWTSDPFVLSDKGDGKMYARGACDMKGFIACCLAMVPEFVAAPLKRPIYFAFSYDEEIGCLSAPELAADIMSYYSERPKYAIIGEATMMQPAVGQKGIVIYKTTVNGSAGHSSRIRQEVSAINEAARLILWLESKMNSLIEEGQIDERFIPPHTTIHCGLMEKSGIAPNVIADASSFYWDVRVIPKDKAADILSEFNAFCRTLEEENRKRFPDFAISTIESHPDVPSLDTPEEVDIVPLVRRLTGRDDLTAVSYAAEAGQFAEAGFQSVICGPGDIAQAHRANEYVAKEQLEGCMNMLRKLVGEFS